MDGIAGPDTFTAMGLYELVLLGVGSSGDAVKKLQAALGVTADGKFGPGTQKAVKDYQAKNGLDVDGFAGPATLAKLAIFKEITPATVSKSQIAPGAAPATASGHRLRAERLRRRASGRPSRASSADQLTRPPVPCGEGLDGPRRAFPETAPMSFLLRFDPDHLGPPEETAPLPERIVSGDPRHLTWNFETLPDGALFAGIWESSPGAWRVDYEEWEFCSLLSGVSILHEDGERRRCASKPATASCCVRVSRAYGKSSRPRASFT